MGKKNICLAITEPYVGSDVANLKTTARLTSCKQYYIVNGNKKWITSGMTSDYFTTAARTGSQGLKGISMLVIPRNQGVNTTKIKVATYSSAAATSYIEFDNVKVPHENLLGKENKGFKIVVFNFNHERWMIAVQTIGGGRDVIQECLRWSMQRKVFGKSLLEQPVIRNKLGIMIARLEATQHYSDWITYQMNTMNPKQQFKLLGGPTALLKLQSTQTAEFVTSEACQIFGGRAVTLGGMGKIVQRARAQIKNSTIYGGSEEIMADLGVRQLAKLMDPEAKL
jgi:alkylation response protein AidB-like acyl-CoA dehydrogenase